MKNVKKIAFRTDACPEAGIVHFMRWLTLADELNEKLFKAELYLLTEAVEKFSYIKPTQQVGEFGKFIRKRSSEDSRIDPHKFISDHFNLLRVVDSK